MLDLYRASAGSGKTYTLAKKFIWYFITISSENGTTRLRTDAELADSARHILAVTFTNKATNEMQMRIVDSLFALATVPPEYKLSSSGENKIVKPVYMQDFVDELKESPAKIASVAGKALSLLLENYSDFNVSTIDSFFQQILRTFAYESDINDSYQVELDSDYLSRVGVDATLEEIDNNSDDADTLFWLKTIVNRTEKGKWNIFARNSSSTGSENPYGDFISSVKKMETEQYKLIRHKIEKYFKDNVDFMQLYKDLCQRYEKPVKTSYRLMKSEFDKFEKWLPEELATASARSHLGKFVSACKKIRTKVTSWNMSPASSNFPVISPDITDTKKVQEWIKSNPETGEELIARFNKAYDTYKNWVDALSTEEFRHWRLYSENLPYYALFSIVTRKKQEFLDESNAIELGETSMILRSVIGESDTPFVYERLGTVLNHFLIDEFQDTSKMQWENLSPLLDESMSRGNDNLIIGDAKQSIYRFRNADPTLITKVVPEKFGENVIEKGNTPSENTNYRSDLHIVRFNNGFFKFLSGSIDSEFAEPEGLRVKFSDIYSNVEQTPFRTSDEGYVEINFIQGSKNAWHTEVISKLPNLISSLIKRGYSQKDIALLVTTNNEGMEIIDSLAGYNLNRPEDEPEIRYVSEQALKIASSKAVSIITGVLENMARGSNPQLKEGEERIRKGLGEWKDMAANFKFYQMQHPDRPISEILDEYIACGSDFNALSDLLNNLQSMAIPALVEAIVSTFVPEYLKIKDALYIAAFQDIVLEYCESHPTDVGSFLKWWERKSLSAAVSSPEDTDAIQIVTVHKSKGLQYKCVIVPFADWSMGDDMPVRFKREWLWVEPQVIKHDSIEMPPYIPVETSEDMRATSHAPLLYKYFDLAKGDKLNAAYVAFTRAEKELYIFSPVSLSDDNKLDVSSYSIGRFLWQYLQDLGYDEKLQDLMVSIGKLPDSVKKKEIVQSSSVLIEQYVSVKSPEFLQYKEENMPEVNLESEDEELDLDPRSEGNIKHAVLERVNISADLPEAIRHMCITGLLPEYMASEIEKSLGEALQKDEVRTWFDGSARVINERPVLENGSMTRRPDRLLVYPDGNAVVIDYKFGHVDKTGKYKRQIKRYVNLLYKTGAYTEIKGFLWYVNENIIEKV